MSETLSIVTTVSGCGSKPKSGLTEQSSEGAIPVSVSLPAALAGTLSTRTDDDTGVLTVASGHEITDAMTVNVFWESDLTTGASGVQYGCTVSSTDTTTISIDAGAGDVLPTVDTVIYVAAQVTIVTLFDGTQLEALFAQADDSRAHISFIDDGSAVELAWELPPSEPKWWFSGQGTTTPLNDDIISILASAGTATAAALTVKILYDAVE